MSDLLVRLYDVGSDAGLHQELLKQGTLVRRALALEKHLVTEWVAQKFSAGWAAEADVAFSHMPIGCFVAMNAGRLLGFACWDATARGFFGPIGVSAQARGRGLGRKLLLGCLLDMHAYGYAYAIVGGATGARAFYERTVGAIEIPGSEPGIYADLLPSARGSLDLDG